MSESRTCQANRILNKNIARAILYFATLWGALGAGNCQSLSCTATSSPTTVNSTATSALVGDLVAECMVSAGPSDLLSQSIIVFNTNVVGGVESPLLLIDYPSVPAIGVTQVALSSRIANAFDWFSYVIAKAGFTGMVRLRFTGMHANASMLSTSGQSQIMAFFEVASGGSTGDMYQLPGISVAVANIAPPPQITTSSLQTGILGVVYSQRLSASGGSPPYSWSLSSGSLPPGLSLNSSTGMILGTPTQLGTFPFIAQVTDSIGGVGSKMFSMTINAPASLSVVPSQLTFSYTLGGSLPKDQTLAVNSTGASMGFSAAVTSGGNWLSVSPSNGTTPSTLNVSVHPSGLPANSYTGNIAINSGGGLNSPQSIPVTLQVVSAPAPTLSAVSPTSINAFGTAMDLTFQGTNFVLGAVVNWQQVWQGTVITSGTLPVSFVSSTQLMASFPSNSIVDGGTINFTVANPTGPQSNSLGIPIILPSPSLTTLNPTSVTAGSAGFTLMVAGTKFALGAQLLWNGTPLNTTFVNQTLVSSAVPASLISGVGTSTITVLNQGSAPSNALTLVIQPPLPAIFSGGVVNIASYAAGAPVAPGSIVAVYGNFLISSGLGFSSVPLPTNLAGVSFEFGGEIQAPLFFVSGGQANMQVPWELAGQSKTSLTVTVNGAVGGPQTLDLAPFSPGIFSSNAQGIGQGAILNANYALVDASNPAKTGDAIQIYCTGLGGVTNQPATGAAAPTDRLAQTITTPVVSIGAVPAKVLFSGLAPGYVGLYQVDVLIPAQSKKGTAVPVVISVGGLMSNTVTMAVN